MDKIAIGLEDLKLANQAGVVGASAPPIQTVRLLPGDPVKLLPQELYQDDYQEHQDAVEGGAGSKSGLMFGSRRITSS